MNRKEAEMRLKDDWYINLTGNLIVEHHKIDKFLEACGMAVEALQEPERKKGRWVDGDCRCPICGGDKFKDLDADIWADWKPPFCPNCGADMRGEKK